MGQPDETDELDCGLQPVHRIDAVAVPSPVRLDAVHEGVGLRARHRSGQEPCDLGVSIERRERFAVGVSEPAQVQPIGLEPLDAVPHADPP